MLRVTCYVLRVTCYVLRVTCYVLRVTCYVLRVTCYVLRVTCYVLRVTCYVSRVTHSLITPSPPLAQVLLYFNSFYAPLLFTIMAFEYIWKGKLRVMCDV